MRLLRAGLLSAVAVLMVMTGSVGAQESELLPQFRPVDKAYRGGIGYQMVIPATGKSNTLGHNLGWGAQHVWESYLSAYKASGEEAWLDRLVLEVDLALQNRDDVLGHADYKGRVRPVWGTTRYTNNGEYHAWVTHNGYTIYQILRFVQLVEDTPELKEKYGAKAERYLQECILVAHQFDDQWREGPLPGMGHYIYPDDLPFADAGQPQRPNHQHGMGLAFIVLSDLTGEEEYRTKAAMMARYFRSTIKKMPNGSYIWTYKPDRDEVRQNVKLFSSDAPEEWTWQQGLSLTTESINYAGLNFYFAYEAYKHGIVFTADDMQAFAKTFLLNMWHPDEQGNPRVAYRVNGKGISSADEDLMMVAMRWISLAEFEPEVYRMAESAYEAADKNANMLIAHVAAANLDMWAQEVRGKIPQIELQYPPVGPTTRVGKELVPQFSVTGFSSGDLEKVSVLVDGESIFEGEKPPSANLVIDTLTLTDGRHTITVTAQGKAAGKLAQSSVFVVANRWTMNDDLEPPQETGWFGVVDRSKTTAESEGWTYNTNDPEGFFGDSTRKSRLANTTEYLVWNAPLLRRFAITLYSCEADLTPLVAIEVSTDGESWQNVGFSEDVGDPTEAGWRKYELTGAVSENIQVSLLRLTLKKTPSYQEVQVGKVGLTGLEE